MSDSRQCWKASYRQSFLAKKFVSFSTQQLQQTVAIFGSRNMTKYSNFLLLRNIMISISLLSCCNAPLVVMWSVNGIFKIYLYNRIFKASNILCDNRIIVQVSSRYWTTPKSSFKHSDLSFTVEYNWIVYKQNPLLLDT